MFSGWLIKLEGGNLEGPEKNDTTKKWCVLQQDTFAYFKNTKSNQEALRYIPMDDVVGVLYTFTPELCIVLIELRL